MGADDPVKIWNVNLIGHGGVGKTTLAEAILLAAGAIPQMGTTVDGTSSFDFEPEEIRRGTSMFASFHHADWKGAHLNVIDSPGGNAFVHETATSLLGATTALLVVPGSGETRGEDEKVLGWAREEGLPVVAVVTHMDGERTDFAAAVAAIAQALEEKPLVVQLPIGHGDSFRGVVDLLHGRAVVGAGREAKEVPVPEEMADEVARAKEQLVEAIAETDDVLLERYFEEGTLEEEDLRTGLAAAVAGGHALPVLCGAGLAAVGTGTLLDFLTEVCPAAGALPAAIGDDPSSGEPVSREPRADEPLSAQIIRTIIDPFAGKLSILRVVSGRLRGDGPLFNSTRSVREKAGHLFRMEGKKHVQISEAVAGDVVALAKLKESRTGDSLSDEKKPAVFALPRGFDAAISYALETEKKGDEDKAVAGLAKLSEEDPALHLERDPQTHEVILGGTGQMHVEAAVERLERKFGVAVRLSAPKVPYKETIGRHGRAEGKVKKQTGGHGQFAVVVLEVEPLARGAGFEFVDRIVGGAVPRNFIPAVEKGLREALRSGTVAGFPVVDVRVTLVDGKHHDVDSSEMAFKTAAALGFRAACSEAMPTLLEPIVALDVAVPEESMGDVIGDLNARRGKVQGVEARGHNQVIRAQVPMAEMLSYAPDVNSMTAGRASFHTSLAHYEELPANVATRVVEALGRAATAS